MSIDPSDRCERITADLFADAWNNVMERRRIPVATYRVQLNRSFSFDGARQIVPYLDALGVTDLYASPCVRAGRDSDHGYDITDHSTLNPVLGSDADFDVLADELRGRGMGLIFDIVPNHMGIAGTDNSWWMDVLENGPSSPYARFFDVDWHPLKAGPDLENRVLLPILGDPYGRALENQELVLEYAEGAFFVRYHDRRMPVAPRCYSDILAARLDELTAEIGSDHGNILELQSIITAIHYLPLETDTDSEKIAERQREKEIIKQRIAKLVDASPEVRAAVEATVRDYNGERGAPRSFDLLDKLLDSQSYRVSFWRVAAEEINYRRFFDVNELAAIRMEQPGVFDETHRLVLDLVRQRKVTGLRIDHVDGLWDPIGYLRQVQQGAFRALCQDWLDNRFGREGAARNEAERELVERFDKEREGNRSVPISCPLYVVVEKILSRGENLPNFWPVYGTTGYDFANLVNELLVDSSNRKVFTNLYAAFTHSPPTDFGDLINSTKKIIMLVSLASEVNELGYQLKRIASKNRLYRDFTLNSLTYAVREVIAALPVYRTYLTDRGEPVQPHDLAAIEAAVAEARRRNPRTASAVFDFVRTVLLQQCPEGTTDQERTEWSNFVMRFQQATGPVMAKGVEDTAFYAYNRLLSLNEVGGDPEQFGIAPSVFHRHNQERLHAWPHTMIAGSTHDSKRSADVRARLNVLSEIPGTWRGALVRWSRQNRRKRTMIDGQPAPDRNDEYLLYQTLLGAWPLQPFDDVTAAVFRQRVQDYMQKAIKEAKIHTSWVNSNRSYDEAVACFVDLILTGSSEEGFLPDFRQLQEYVAFFGMLNALSQTLLQLTSPGVPDIYQGTELWDFSLVDPDNRRTVDYARRTRLLGDLIQRIDRAHEATDRTLPQVAGRKQSQSSEPVRDSLARVATDLLRNWRDGRVKLYLMHRALSTRRANGDVFARGDYRPLDAGGTHRDHVVGFARSLEGSTFLTVVPRLPVGLTHGHTILPLGAAVWGDTTVDVPPGMAGATFRNVFTDEEMTVALRGGTTVFRVADLLGAFPVALLQSES